MNNETDLLPWANLLKPANTGYIRWIIKKKSCTFTLLS